MTWNGSLPTSRAIKLMPRNQAEQPNATSGVIRTPAVERNAPNDSSAPESGTEGFSKLRASGAGTRAAPSANRDESAVKQLDKGRDLRVARTLRSTLRP